MEERESGQMSAEFETIYHVLPVTEANRQNPRRQRLADRLKENLRKRKAQKRARDQEGTHQSAASEGNQEADSVDGAGDDTHHLDIEA